MLRGLGSAWIDARLFALAELGLDAVDGPAADGERTVGQLLDGDHEELLRNGSGFGCGESDLFDEGLFLRGGQRTALDGDIRHGGK